MAQTTIRIIYDPATHEPKRFIIPHSDEHLDYHPPEEAEAHIDITIDQWRELQRPPGPDVTAVGPDLNRIKSFIEMWAK